MSAKDRYRIGLECLDCGKSGEAKISENDGWAFQNNKGRQVDSVSEGFIIIDHGANHGQKTMIGCKCGSVRTYVS